MKMKTTTGRGISHEKTAVTGNCLRTDTVKYCSHYENYLCINLNICL